MFRSCRRRRLAKRPFPPEWIAHLEKNVPFFRGLDGDRRERYLRLLKVFAWEKHFFGAGGLEMTDEIRVVVSAAAVRLILDLDLSYYNRLTEIVVYPYVYRHPDQEGAILGEAHTFGTVVLSWPAVLSGVRNPRDGHDTAIHEFAHVLDVADGSFDGTPRLHGGEDYRPWAEVMTKHYFALRRGGRRRRKVLRAYGATNEAEFFAVATEAFFEKPRQMKKLSPELYEELRRFYGSDPAGAKR